MKKGNVAFSFLNKNKSFLIHNLWAGLSTLCKALAQLFILKLATMQLGAAGLGIIGQALSCTVIFQNFTSGGVLNYTITTLANTHFSNEHKKNVFGTVALWAALITIVFLALSFVISTPISEYVFLKPEYNWFFILLAAISFTFSMLMLGNGILSANKDVKALFLSNLGTLLISIFAFYYLVDKYAIIGALYGVLAFYLIQGSMFLLFAFKKKYLHINELIPLHNKDQIKLLTGFSLLVAVSGVLSNLYLVSIRSYLVSKVGFSWDDIGLWQSVVKISDVALSFIAVSIMTSYLPAISQAHDKLQIKKVISDHSKKMIPLILVTCSIIALFAPFILTLIYSADFAKAKTLLRYQMLGDVFKFSTSLFTYFFIARAKIFVLIIYEIICVALLSALSVYFVAHYALNGLLYAHILSSVSAALLAFIVFKTIQRPSFKNFLKS